MFRLRNARALVFLVPICAGFWGCVTHSSPEPPEAVVERFLRLDFDGARLAPVTHRQIDPLVVWKARPGWETVYVVSGYDIADVKTRGDSAEVTAKYSVLGKAEAAAWRGMNETDPELSRDLAENATVTFKLSRTPAGWRITDPMFYPHVSPQALSSHIKSRTQVTKDVRLQQTVQVLDEMSQ